MPNLGGEHDVIPEAGRALLEPRSDGAVRVALGLRVGGHRVHLRRVQKVHLFAMSSGCRGGKIKQGEQ